MTETSEGRSERVDLRMTPAAKLTLQRAAAVTNKTLTEFLLNSGTQCGSRHACGPAGVSTRRKTLECIHGGACSTTQEESPAA